MTQEALVKYLPQFLFRAGPQELLYWQWLALPILLLISWSAGLVLGRITRALLLRFWVLRTKNQWDDRLLQAWRRPIAMVWALTFAFFALPALELTRPAETLLHQVLKTGFLIVFFWATLASVDVVADLVRLSPSIKNRAAVHSFIPLLTKISKISLVGLAIVVVLSMMGYPVVSLIAGLGIGGVAVALAAQKTVENVFGSISIGADQPFRVGDFVKIENTVGHIETIGLRSTRMRTLDRTVIIIPNGKLAELRIENYQERDRLRLHCKIGLSYDIGPTKLQQVCAGFIQVLKAHPKVWQDDIAVAFEEFGENALIVDVMAWFRTSEWGEFRRIREQVLLQFMEVVHSTGTQFAFPTRTVHLVQKTGASVFPQDS